MGAVKPLDYLRAIRDSRDLSASEKLVALTVMSHTGPGGTDAHPGEKLLAEETGLSEKTVRKHLRTLREKGWLMLVFSGRGGSHERASIFNLSIPTGNQYRLEEDAQEATTGNERPPNRYLATAQPVTKGSPTGNGYRTTALRTAPRTAPRTDAAAEPPVQVNRGSRGIRARQDIPASPRPVPSPDGSWPEYEYPAQDYSSRLPALAASNEPDWEY